jgi:hypothetical protein
MLSAKNASSYVLDQANIRRGTSIPTAFFLAQVGWAGAQAERDRLGCDNNRNTK